MNDSHPPAARDRTREGRPGKGIARAAKTTVGSAFCCVSIGSSMEPTLFDRELLEVVPYRNARPRVGDVILFRPPWADAPVVHRVIGFTGGRLRTRGDNNRREDEDAVRLSDVVGRVRRARQGTRERVIHGGVRGRVTALRRRLVLEGLHRFGRLVRPLYRALIRAGVVQRLLPAAWRPRLITVRRDGVSLHRLLFRGHLVGYWEPGGRRWRIRPLYRLLVDERELRALAAPRDRETVPPEAIHALSTAGLSPHQGADSAGPPSGA